MDGLHGWVMYGLDRGGGCHVLGRGWTKGEARRDGMERFWEMALAGELAHTAFRAPGEAVPVVAEADEAAA